VLRLFPARSSVTCLKQEDVDEEPLVEKLAW